MRKALVGVASLSVVASLNVVSSPPAHAWGAPVPVSPAGSSAFEPTIDIGPNGTMYITGATGVPSYSGIWRSTTNGASWTALNNLLRPTCPGGGDIDLTISPDQTPGALTDSLAPSTGKPSIAITELWLGNSSVCRNDAEGGNGITPNIANEVWVGQPFQGPPGQDRQWVDHAGKDPLGADIVYHLVHQLEGGLVVSKSFDGGITYPVHNLAATPVQQNLCLCPPGNIVAEHHPTSPQPGGINDRVAFVYTTSNGVAVNVSHDGGVTWTRTVLGANGGDDTTESFPVIAADPNSDDLHVVWLATNPSTGKNEVNYRSSSNWGGAGGATPAWSATTTTLVNSGTSVFPWIDAIGDDVVVSLYHTTSTSSTGSAGSVGATASWDLGYLESTDGGSTWSALSTPDTGIKTGPICTAGLSCTSGRQFGDFQSVAISPTTGDVTIAYMEIAAGGQRILSITGP